MAANSSLGMGGTRMSILLGVLLYALGVLFFCALTRANGSDEAHEPFLNARRSDERFAPVRPHAAAHAPEAHG